MAAPRDAHLWLPADQQEEWIESKKQVPTLVFGTFVAFNVLSRLSLRILNRKGNIKDPGNQVLLQYGATAITHAIISLMASFFILMRRDLSHCGDQLFCHDDLSARLWTVRAGYSLYEFLFWQNNGGVVKPWNEMLLLHNTVVFMMAIASLLYPCRLSLILLPLQQLFQAAVLVDCVRRFLSIYGTPWHIRFKAYLAFIAAFAAKAAGAALLAAYAFWWIRSHSLWTLQLPEGMSSLNQVYGMVFLAGSTILAMVYIKWCGAAVEMTNRLVSEVQSRNRAAADVVAGAKATKAPSGNRKKERQRR